MNSNGTTLDRTTFAWVAVAVVAALAPVALSFAGWLAALLFGIAALGIGFGWRGQLLTPWVRLPLTIGVAALVLSSHGFAFGRDTGAALLAAMLALKLLETRRIRDARSVLSFALFALMASFLQNQGPTTLLLALCGGILVIAVRI
jgi:hypothetical protein